MAAISTEPPFLGFSKVRHEAPAAECAVNLEDRSKNHIGKREPGATLPLNRHDNSITQVAKQDLKVILFFSLGSIVGTPVLLVSRPFRDLKGFGHGCSAVRVQFAGDHVSYRHDVLAVLAAQFVIRTCAVRSVIGNSNGIFAWAGLGRHQPLSTAFHDPELFGNFQCTGLSQCEFHGQSPFLNNSTPGCVAWRLAGAGIHGVSLG